MELEVWPNFVFTAGARHVPVVVVNGRISDRSFVTLPQRSSASRARSSASSISFWRRPEQYAERFRELGCPAERVLVTSSLKYDTAQVADRVEGAESLAEQLNLAGSQAVGRGRHRRR